MIINYEIGYKNKEEILFIYLDYNTEFAKFNSNVKKKKLKNEIKKYIKKNKIDFKGTIVAIMVGGLMVGTIMLNKPRIRNISYNSKNNIIAILDDTKVFNNDDLLFDNDDEISSNVVEDKGEVANNNVIKKEENKVKESKEIRNVENKENRIKEKEEFEPSKKEVIDNTKYINLYRSNGSVLNIELEEYVIGVVAAEMPASFNKEALKAQSVVARTYALKSLSNNKLITDNSSTQNYKSISELKNMWGISFDTYYNKIVNAVNSTKGEFLSYNGEYIDAVYHSTSNGKTEDSINVWGNSFPYLVSVESKYDNTNKSFITTTFMSYEDISNKLGTIVTSDSVFNIVSRNESGRVSNIEIDGISYTGVNIRTLLGLRSTDFDIEKVSNGINITTKGYGHGVGMSQYGANGMANNGYSYKDILLYYYKGVSLNKN